MLKFFFLILFPFCLLAQNSWDIEVNATLDAWHKAASEANYNRYFDTLSDDAIFIGTDASEMWTKSEFQNYAKPYFDKGKAWDFTCLRRHIYFNAEKTIAWFDELLDTRMKVCRGSGILFLTNGHWKIKHYVLSMTIPNDTTEEVVKIKSPIEEHFLTELKNKKE